MGLIVVLDVLKNREISSFFRYSNPASSSSHSGDCADKI